MRTVLLVLVVGLSGCSGMELGGKMGIYRVDQMESSQSTQKTPFKCLWTNCASAQKEEGGS